MKYCPAFLPPDHILCKVSFISFILFYLIADPDNDQSSPLWPYYRVIKGIITQHDVLYTVFFLVNIHILKVHENK